MGTEPPPPPPVHCHLWFVFPPPGLSFLFALSSRLTTGSLSRSDDRCVCVEEGSTSLSLLLSPSLPCDTAFSCFPPDLILLLFYNLQLLQFLSSSVCVAHVCEYVYVWSFYGFTFLGPLPSFWQFTHPFERWVSG